MFLTIIDDLFHFAFGIGKRLSRTAPFAGDTGNYHIGLIHHPLVAF